MKQLLQSFKTGEMILEEVPCPAVSAGTLLVETLSSVVSAGTEKSTVGLAKKSLVSKAKARPDLVRKVIDAAKKDGLMETFQMVKAGLNTPIPLGYSCSGIVRAIGEQVEGIQPGDFVACGGGGYANHSEYNIIPKNLCVKVPGTSEDSDGKRITADEAAFATLGAIALQGVRQAAPTLGENVCIIGLGLIGQLTVQLCKANGTKVIGVDIDSEKLKLASVLGADKAVHSAKALEEIDAFTAGVGADAVIITAAAKNNELIALAGNLSRMKGRVVVVGLVGLDVPRSIYYRKELDLKFSMSYGPGRYDVAYEEQGHDYPIGYVRWTEQRNMQAFLDLVYSEKILLDPLITHRFPFENVLDAYSLIMKGEEPYLGVLLQYAAQPEPDKITINNTSSEIHSDSIGIGCIGAGNFTKAVLLPRMANAKNVNFCGIASGTGISAKEVGKQFDFSYCCSDPEKIINDKSVHAVFITTRHDSHGEFVEKAITAGKHVFVEKPLCLTEEQLEKINAAMALKAQEGKSPIVMVGFNRRFSPYMEKIRNVFSERKTPLILSYRVCAGFVPKDSWVQDPAQGGRIIGEVCHFVDVLRFLVGSPIVKVQATSSSNPDISQTDRDTVSITLMFEDGSLGNIIYYTTGNRNYPKEKLDAAADGISVELNDYRELNIYQKNKTQKQKSKQQKGHSEEILHFINAISTHCNAPIPFKEIVDTTAVTFAVHQALNTGNTILI
jgi:predicted dehydrogenase